MINKIKELMSNDNRNLREKLFVIICLEGLAASVISLVECLMIGSGWFSYAVILATIIIIPWAVSYVVHRGGVEIPIATVTLWMNVVVFPMVFFCCGGVRSGSNCWLAMGIIYIFLVYRGKPMVIYLLLTGVVDLACYVVAYIHPEYVRPLDSELSVYIDSAFGMIAVGVTAGMIFTFRRAGYAKESAMAMRQRNEIDRINASRERFYANFSHEIRNPINAIVGLNELNLRVSTDEQVTKNSQAIARSGKLLLSIVNDIMDLSQIENHSMQLSLAPFNSSSVFTELMEMINKRASDKGLTLKLESDPELPKILIGDERRIVQIVLNLLTNAVKYTEEGGVTVRVASEKIGNNRVRIKISVSDTGIGIEKKNIEHLFETYSQFDRESNNKIEGNGLGLPIAYELTSLMGGKLTVDSVYGQGSTFTADLTLGFEGDEVIGGSTYEEISRESGVNSSYVRSFEASRAKILVVDDDAQNRSIISGLLKDTKVEVTEAGSGEEALKLTALNEYQVIIVDYLMPGMTGTEVLEAIRTQSGGKCRESSIIALTGANLDGRMHNNVLYDFDMVLTKPVEYTVLENAIADSLPEELIDYRAENKAVAASFTSVMAKRKRRIRITTESICDIPEDLIKKYDIGIMYLYIKTSKGRFMDTIEIDSSDLMGKLTESKREIVPDGATVKEYEDFFGKELESSEEIIHLSFSSKMGESCGRAMEAAKSFSHVTVIDSGQISSGLGLMAIIASGWAMSERSVDAICADIQKLSKNIELSFLLPSAAIYAEYGRMAKKRGEIYDALNIHPAISISGGKLTQVRAYHGDMDKVISKHIKTTLALAGRMDRRVPVIVTHVGLAPRTQNNILRQMKRTIPENMLVLTKSSVSSAGNIGKGGVGIAFLRQSHLPDWRDPGASI